MTTIENLQQENARLRSLLSDWEQTYEKQSVQLRLSKENAYEWEQKFTELERISTSALLAALQSLADNAHDALAFYGKDIKAGTQEDPADILLDLQEALTKAEAAIAKATQQP